jgi:hypothetical protein
VPRPVPPPHPPPRRLPSPPPVAVKGLAGSSISSRKLAVAARPSSARAACRSTRRAAVVAKYGDKSVYFDLDDIGDTTGQWDLYGSDAPSPYNPLHVLRIYYDIATSKLSKFTITWACSEFTMI